MPAGRIGQGGPNWTRRAKVNEEDDMIVSADEIKTMTEEIQRGLTSGRSSVAMTDTHRQVWDDLTDQHYRHR
jgi:hypothetical protein